MPAIDVVQLFGPQLLGVFFNMILYGIFVMQTYNYHQTRRQDVSWWIKYLITYLFVMETFDTGTSMSIMFEPLITNFGQLSAVQFFPKMFGTRPFTVVLISTPIQIFFAWRVKVLTKSNVLALTVIALSLMSFAGGLYTGTLVYRYKLLTLKEQLNSPALIWFIPAAVADVLITVVLVVTLSRHKTGFATTDDAVSKIIRTTVQTGMLTAFFAVMDIIFFMSLPHSAINFVFDLCLSKLYANCLLSQLNARKELRERMGYKTDVTHPGISLSDIHRQEHTTKIGSTTTHDSEAYKLESRVIGAESQTTGKYGIQITKSVDIHQDSQYTQETQ